MAHHAELQAFSFTKLPVEIQKLITRHELALAPNRQVPALLIALASDKENGKSYYEYARAQYRKINFVVSIANDTKFRAMKLWDLKLIRHLTLVLTRTFYDSFGYVQMREGLRISRSLAIICNRFKTITLDMTSEEIACDPADRPQLIDKISDFQYLLLSWSMNASTVGVKRVVVVFDKSGCASAEIESKFVRMMDHLMGLGSPRIEDEVHTSAYGANIKVLIWEKESGASLRTKRY